MRSSVLKSIILASAIIIASLVAVQLVWLNKQFNFEQKTFSNNVIKSIREVYIDVALTEDKQTKLGENIQRINDNNFIFRVDFAVNKDTLIYNIVKELENFDLFTDCKVAYYSVKQKSYVYEVYIPAAASLHPSSSGIDLQIIDKDFSYIHLFFPHRSTYILQGLWLWISLSCLLILALLGLSISIFYLYKQKFLNEIQKDFINNVTHEFQTPITTLQLGLEVLSNPNIISQPEKIAKYTAVMRTQTDYLKHHLENLMLVIRADARILRFKKEKVIINNLVKDAVHQLSMVASQKNATFEFHLEGHDTPIQADRNNMFLVIVNLLSNAIKYSKLPHIILTTTVEGGNYVLRVQDNGIGIEAKYMKNLFRKFYRVPSGDKHDTKGLGLGLYFVKKIIEMHNGSVEVKSEVNKGSEFKLIIPIT
jgi:two-component system phosphate regulon sensor histidine kinase PhoR